MSELSTILLVAAGCGVAISLVVLAMFKGGRCACSRGCRGRGGDVDSTTYLAAMMMDGSPGDGGHHHHGSHHGHADTGAHHSHGFDAGHHGGGFDGGGHH